MINQLQSPTETLSPPPPVNSPFSMEWLRRLNAACGSEGGRPKLMHGVEVSMDQARQIEVSILAYRRSLSPGPGDVKAKGIAISRLVTSFPIAPGEQGMRADAYLEAVENLPAWAVERAVGRFIRGEAGIDTRFCPAPPQVAQEVRKTMEPARADLAALERLKKAVADRDIPPDEHRRVSDGFDKLLAELAPQRNKEKTVAQARAALEEICREEGIDPAAIDAVPNQPERKQVGTWSKLSAQPERTEA